MVFNVVRLDGVTEAWEKRMALPGGGQISRAGISIWYPIMGARTGRLPLVKSGDPRNLG